MKSPCIGARVRVHWPSCDSSNSMVSMSYSDVVVTADHSHSLTASIAATLARRGEAKKRVLVEYCVAATCWHTA